MDPEAPSTEQDLDGASEDAIAEAFENIVLREQIPRSWDDDWMPGEFDIA